MTLSPDEADTGYRIVGGVLGEREASDLLWSLESSSLRRSRAGARHLMGHPGIQTVAHDPRLLAIAGEFLAKLSSDDRVHVIPLFVDLMMLEFLKICL